MPFFKGSLLNRITAVLFIILLFGGCKQESVAGKGFRFPISAEPRQIDPQVSTDNASVTVLAALFEGLARLDETGNPQPAAAAWTVSGDGLTYTFTLHDSKWNDGTDVTAHDFVFGMQRAVLPSTHSSLAEQLFEIKNAREVNAGSVNVSKLGVKAVSDKTLTITLVRPNADFPLRLTTTPFMPCKQTFFESTGGRYGLETEYVLTNGAFYLKKWTHNESLLLNKNEGYHDAKVIYPAAVRYMIGGVDQPVETLSKGLLDAAPIPVEKLAQAKEAGLKLVTQKDSIRMVWLNNSNKALANMKIRQALRDSLEWKTIYAQFNKQTDIPATGFITPDAIAAGQKYRSDKNVINPVTNAQGATAKLAAGMAQAGLDKMPTLTLICAEDDYSQNIARYVVQSWQKNLSLYFSIEVLPASEIDARVKVGNYQIALYTYTAQDAEAIDAFSGFAAGTAGNYAHFSDAGYNARLSAVSGNASRAELESLEKQLWQACPSIPISFELHYVGIPEADSGIIVRPFGGGAFGAPYDFSKAGRKGD